MTPDDFKQKCDEIHKVLCYLDDNENIPRADIYKPMDVWFGHINLRWNEFVYYSVLECAIRFMEKRKEIMNMDGAPVFYSDKWTME